VLCFRSRFEPDFAIASNGLVALALRDDFGEIIDTGGPCSRIFSIASNGLVALALRDDFGEIIDTGGK
jgi:hypothetical protein